MGFVFDPQTQLQQLFPNEESLTNIDDALAHISRYKEASRARLQQKLAQYNADIDVTSDVAKLQQTLLQVRNDAKNTHDNILSVTSKIQKLDTTKRNLVLSMNVLKRLQMLISANEKLNEVAQTRDYEQIASLLGAVHKLIEFFKSYKSIDEIARMNKWIHQTQRKVVDDVFIDFEDSFTNHFTNSKLNFGCEILELSGSKYKDKLLTWFYNLQLKEMQSIFSGSGEAASIENVNRRFIFFTNVLANIRSNFMHAFPKTWGVDVELSKLFCKMTYQEISSKLSAQQVPSTVILEALTATLLFEKQLNDTFRTEEFSRMVSSSFEPYLITWVKDQDVVLRGKFMELHSRPKVPTEIAAAASVDELIRMLQFNSVPNFAESSQELFRMFQKSLAQTLKLSSGEILLEMARVFAKHLREYHRTVLLPVLYSASVHPQGIEPIKYLTMLFNTADFVVKNTKDLQDRLVKLIDDPFKSQVSFDTEIAIFFELIGKSIRGLVSKVEADLSFSWRQFENNNWEALEPVSDTSRYMDGIVASLTDNHRMICPLIIREGYVRNYADKLVEAVVFDFIKRLSSIPSLTLNAIEQLLLDVSVLKKFFKSLLLFSDINFDIQVPPQDLDSKVPKAYSRHLNAQFAKIELLLKLLLAPNLPIDNIVETYFSIIGDKSLKNFEKILTLKGISANDQQKYLENFKLQVLSRDLVDESPILAGLHEVKVSDDESHPSSQPQPQPIDLREAIGSRSPEPNFLKSNSAKIQALKLNNPLRDFSLSGESHVNKFNENFKNFGKFFRKDFDTYGQSDER